ncbi:hypothetical protein OBBRIDRAFT_376786 [Obba rivulosa]|uniref:Uncharacterized protein n=1 Tax=Obba rivulosa TaxID=1052685 RepID=A0A8E2AII4_9APHY|nr:hypothetical protein OBBRIDRAFT_376786 [Obba rivulosa]
MTVQPKIVRTISLIRDIEQVQEFCAFVLTYDLTSYTRHLHIERKALYPRFSGDGLEDFFKHPPNPDVIFARILGDVLEKAEHLESLDLDGTEMILQSESQFGAKLIARPPTVRLRLSDVGEKNFAGLGALRSPPSIALSPTELTMMSILFNADAHRFSYMAPFFALNAPTLRAIELGLDLSA